mmetsp:Transcript_3123/g.6809  ORF Transcript_3123/g.6809 Transcript_3123/m.6809 type:complete len:1041 (+) Transcript_3123:95-3217(+)
MQCIGRPRLQGAVLFAQKTPHVNAFTGIGAAAVRSSQFRKPNQFWIHQCFKQQGILPSKAYDDRQHSQEPSVDTLSKHQGRLGASDQPISKQPARWNGLAVAAAKVLGSMAVLLVASLAGGVRAAHADTRTSAVEEASSTVATASSATAASTSGRSLAELFRGPPEGKSQQTTPTPPVRGVALGYDDLMRSMVYDPADVPLRRSKTQIAEQLNAIMNQYDAEDFDLGIKQFMIEQAIQQDLEDGVDKAGGNKDFEEKLAEALFAGEDDDGAAKDVLKTDDMVTDAFTTEAVEEYLTLFGDQSALSTAWRVSETLRDLSYTQFWTLVGEGHIEEARFFGPEKRALLALTRSSAPGGARVVKVVVAPDPMLFDHMVKNGVRVDAGTPESERLQRAFMAQVLRYAFPFMFISAVFWLLHTWVLDPLPNAFKRQEFLRYRRELMYITSKLNFRSPAREVRIDTNSPDFIPWDEIHGIDEVKKEILEIIDYLKNPALLRQRGVARIGGVLLAGAPGTGKTLMAKAIAAESGVRMFTCSGTDFFDVFTGVGARRIRETFEKLRNNSPAILFVDEFDALGAARGAQASGDESTSIINELLVQLDGFEDNRGIVVLGATNRPGAIDTALIRPGRFDRIIYMPLPDAAGRAKILQVHARNKAVDPKINWYEVARSMAGFTGADCMGLMQRAARMAARQGRDCIVEEDIYSAMENKALEAYTETANVQVAGADAGTPDPIPPNLRRAVAVYEAGKALLAYITPEYDEIARVSVCPFNLVTGYTLFVEDEQKKVDAILTRADMESHMVVNLAGRAAEKLVLGEGELTGIGAPDVFHANMIAREMILGMGMGRRMGPLDLMQVVANQQNSGLMLRTSEPTSPDDEYFYHATDMSTEQSRVALAEVVELVEAAEAKAMYGLAINWKPLQALVEALLEQGVLQGKEVAHILETNGVIHFPDPYTEGFGWDEKGTLKYPFKPVTEEPSLDAVDAASGKEPVLSGVKGKTWYAGTDKDAPRDKDGNIAYGWHWNMPYTLKRNLPEWYNQEVERYKY